MVLELSKATNNLNKEKLRLLFKSILLNVTYVIFFNVFFVPQNDVDNAWQWYYINGAFTDETSSYLLWGNRLLGKLLKLLTDTFPNVVWYSVLIYLITFIAFTTFVYVILQYDWGIVGWLICNFFLLFAGFEIYITLSFTKVSGIVGATALFALLSNKLNYVGHFFCMTEVILSVMFRDAYIYMLLAVFSFNVLLKILHDFANNKKSILKNNKCNIFFVFCLFLLCTFINSNMINYSDDTLKEFIQRHAFRSACYDRNKIYGNYDTYRSEYEDLGITENEAELWTKMNMDMCFPDDDTMISALNIGHENEEEKSFFLEFIERYMNIDKIYEFFKVFPSAFFSIDCFYLLIIVFILLFPILEDKKWKILVFSYGFCLIMAFEYYLCIGEERSLKHRIDVTLCIIVVLCCLQLLENKKVNLCKFHKSTLLLVFLILIIVPFDKNADYYLEPNGKLDKCIKNNIYFYDVVRKDENHVYLQLIEYNIGNGRGFFDMFVTASAFGNVEKGYYNNVFLSLSTPNELRQLEKYNISDWFVDIVDNEYAFLLLSSNDKMKDLTEQYIEDRTNKDVSLFLAKNYRGKYIYRVCTEDFRLENQTELLNENWDSVSGDFDIHVNGNKELSYSGNVYIESDNIFVQNAYIVLLDSKTGIQRTYCLLERFENEKDELCISLEGDFSLPEFYDCSDAIYILLENNGIYRTKLINIE